MIFTTRRHMLRCLMAAAATTILPAYAGKGSSATAIPMEVWKDPQCGCCKDWIALMEKAGFNVRVHDTGNTAVRSKLGLPDRLGSCHTALVNGYVVEGHVPVADVQRLLKEKPKALGITVPGMPIGSPGMDGPVYGSRKDPYDVLLVARSLIGGDVRTSVFSSHRG